jgi:hypothetical protein
MSPKRQRGIRRAEVDGAGGQRHPGYRFVEIENHRAFPRANLEQENQCGEAA